MTLVEIVRRNRLGFIVMSREDKLNALNREMLQELIKAVEHLESDPETAVISLTGRGRAFSAGIDLVEAAKAETQDEVAKLFRDLATLFNKLLTVEKPLIIGVNGAAYGGGAELLWTGDIVIAVREAKIAWPEARWGLVPPVLASIGPLIIGPQRAAYLAMTSTVITAEEAYGMGLVSRIVDSQSDLWRAIEETASLIMQHSPQAIRAIKKMIQHSKLNIYTSLGISELERLSRTREAINAAKSFREKKQPLYKW